MEKIKIFMQIFVIITNENNTPAKSNYDTRRDVYDIFANDP